MDTPTKSTYPLKHDYLPFTDRPPLASGSQSLSSTMLDYPGILLDTMQKRVITLEKLISILTHDVAKLSDTVTHVDDFLAAMYPCNESCKTGGPYVCQDCIDKAQLERLGALHL